MTRNRWAASEVMGMNCPHFGAFVCWVRKPSPLFIVIPTLGGISVELYVSLFSKPALHLNAFLGYEALRGKHFFKVLKRVEGNGQECPFYMKKANRGGSLWGVCLFSAVFLF